MRIAHLADLHVMEHVRFKHTIEILHAICKDIFSRNVDCIAITGDLAGRDAPHRLTYLERHRISFWLRMLSDIAPVILIRGNHDVVQEFPVLGLCCGDNSIVTFTDTIDAIPIRGINFVGVPWMPLRTFLPPNDSTSLSDMQAEATVCLKRMIQVKQNALPTVILGHGTCQGAMVGDFEVQSVRDIVYPVGFFDDLSPLYVGMGHFHRRQQVAGNALVYYPGSPYPVDFSEVESDKGYLLIDIEDDQTVSITPISIPSWRMLTLTGAVTHDGKIEWAKHADPMEMPVSMFDNTYVRAKLDMHRAVPGHQDIGLVQQRIMRFGGFFGPDHIVATTPSPKAPRTSENRPLAVESADEAIRSALCASDRPDDVKTALLGRFEDIVQHAREEAVAE